MDPQYEQRLRDEVIYLHSLWHQGPPTPATASSSSRHHLHLSKPTPFKKLKKNPKPKKLNKSKTKTNNPDTEQPNNPSPGIEWPCPTPPPPLPADTWLTHNPKTQPKPQTLSPDQQLQLAARNAHKQALKVVHEYFTRTGSDDDDEVDDGDELMGEDDGRVEYSFFLKVFKEDALLREHYEKNFAKGEFTCLVCGAVGGKGTGKRFKGCLPLVQHAITIARTRRRRAHRAFGQAVCKVLGWDIDHLSAIVSLLSEKPGRVEAQENVDCGDKDSSIFHQENVNGDDKDSSTVPQENVNSDNKDCSISVQENSNGDNKGSLVLLQENVNSDNRDSSITIVNNGDAVEGDNGDIIVPESGTTLGYGIVSPNGVEGDTNSLTCVDTDKNLEDHNTVHPHVVEEPVAQGLTSDSNACPDADENLEDPGMMHPHSLKEPASESLKTNSLVCTDIDNNMGDPSVMHPYNVFVPLNKNTSAETEMQEWLMSNAVLNAVLDGRKEDDETEN